jgi:hypothetical protein
MKLHIVCCGLAALSIGLCGCDPKPSKPKTEAPAAQGIAATKAQLALHRQPLDEMRMAILDQRPRAGTAQPWNGGLQPSRSASGIAP